MRGFLLRASTVVAAISPLQEPPKVFGATSPYPQSPVVLGLSFDFSQHVRRAPGSDNWPLTWGWDDHQYTSWGDGGGFSGNNTACRVSLGFGRVEGSATGYAGHDLWGDPNCADHPAQFGGKTQAIISIDGTLYMWRSPGSEVQGLDYQRLYRSTNGSATWTDTGVEWTYGTHRIGFFAFLQFGRDNQAARDGYVYIYGAHLQAYAWGVQKPGLLYLLRVPKAQLATQSAYQFFTGLDGSGAPQWGSFAARRPVFTDPNGVMRTSAIYNPGLRRYFLVTNHTQNYNGNLAILDAPEPWGPWTTVAYYDRWPVGGQVPQNTFLANFAPKWLSADGRDFVFVFTGKESNDSWNSVPGRFTVASVSEPGPSSPLAGHWRFDEGAGLTAADASGNGLIGTLINGPVWTTGVDGSAIRFDGAQDYVRVLDPGSSSPVDLRADFTISAWANFAALPASGGGRNPRILQKGSSTGIPGSYYLSARTSTAPSVISLRLKFAGTTYTLDGAKPLTTGLWTHVAVTKQGGVVRIYQNGIQDGPSFTVPNGAPDAGTEALYMGESPNNTDGALGGSLDDVRIYARALSGSAIFNIAHSTVG